MLKYFIAIILTILPSGVLFAQQENSVYDADFVQSVSQMRLFRLAEIYLKDQLEMLENTRQQESDFVENKARLTAALIDIVGQQALIADANQQEKFYLRSQKLAEDFLAQYSDSPARSRVLYAQLVEQKNAGELGALNVQLRPTDEKIKQDALNHLRQATEIGRKLEQLSISEPRNSLGDQRAINQFSNQISYLQAQILISLAQCYPENSPERADSINQALDRLKKLSGLSSSDPLFWVSRLLRVTATRLSGDTHLAGQAIDFMLSKQKPPVELALDFQAEKLNLLTKTDPSAAAELQNQLYQQLINTFSQADPHDDAAHLAVLKSMLAQMDTNQSSSDGNNAKMEPIIQWADLMRRYDTGFYAQSAQQILSAIALKSLNAQTGAENGNSTDIPSDSDSVDVSMITLAAENLFRSGQFAQSIEMYLKGAKVLEAKIAAADNSSVPDPTFDKSAAQSQAFQFRYIAAAVAHQQNDHLKAIELFESAASRYPQNPQAASALKSALFHAGKLIKSDNPNSIHQYTKLLDEYISLFPQSPSIEEIRKQRLQVCLFNTQPAQQVEQLCGLLDSMAGTEESYLSILETALQAADTDLSNGKTEGRDTAAMASRYIIQFNKYVSAAASRQVLIHESFWQSEYTAQIQTAIEKLQSALKNPQNAGQTPELIQWRAQASAVLISLLVTSGQTDQALGLMNQLAGADTQLLLAVAKQWGAQVESMSEQTRPAAAQAVLKTISLIEQQPNLDNSVKQTLQRRKAEMMLYSNQTDSALKLYQQQAKQFPQDAAVQKGYAIALTQSGDTVEALNQWRSVAAHTKSYSENWYQAKYEIARLLVQNGQKKQAREMINLIKLLHPDLGGSVWKEKFEKILSE